MPHQFEAGKTYKTRDGHDAFIYCVDAPGNYPIHGRVGVAQCSWNLGGRNSGHLRFADLMPPEPERVKVKRWVNVYNVGLDIYELKRSAKLHSASPLRTAVPCWLTEILPGEEGYDDE